MRTSSTPHGSALFLERERRRKRHTQRRRERRGTSRTKKRENSWEAPYTLYSSCATMTATVVVNSGRYCVERGIHRPGYGALRPCRPCSPRPCSGCWSLKISALAECKQERSRPSPTPMNRKWSARAITRREEKENEGIHKSVFGRAQPSQWNGEGSRFSSTRPRVCSRSVCGFPVMGVGEYGAAKQILLHIVDSVSLP